MSSTAPAHPTPSHSDQVGTWAGTLAIAEVGIGSFMHAAHVPLTGTLLSINQGLFLSRITRLNHDLPGARTLGFEVSTVTALLKSFAPVGKKLTPMLAIGVQGFLFSLGTGLFGANLVGVIIGSMLLAIWGIVQPAILAGIMISTLSDSEWQRVQSGWQKMVSDVEFLQSMSLTEAVMILAAAKCAIAAVLAIIAWFSSVGDPKSFLSRWETFINRRARIGTLSINTVPADTSLGLRGHIQLALKDLRHPLVWLSALLISLFSFFVDSQFIAAIWLGMRGIGGLFIVYLLLRLLPWDLILNRENKHARALRSAILVIQGQRQTQKSPSAVDASESEK